MNCATFYLNHHASDSSITHGSVPRGFFEILPSTRSTIWNFFALICCPAASRSLNNRNTLCLVCNQDSHSDSSQGPDEPESAGEHDRRLEAPEGHNGNGLRLFRRLEGEKQLLCASDLDSDSSTIISGDESDDAVLLPADGEAGASEPGDQSSKLDVPPVANQQRATDPEKQERQGPGASCDRGSGVMEVPRPPSPLPCALREALQPRILQLLKNPPRSSIRLSGVRVPRDTDPINQPAKAGHPFGAVSRGRETKNGSEGNGESRDSFDQAVSANRRGTSKGTAGSSSTTNRSSFKSSRLTGIRCAMSLRRASSSGAGTPGKSLQAQLGENKLGFPDILANGRKDSACARPGSAGATYRSLLRSDQKPSTRPLTPLQGTELSASQLECMRKCDLGKRLQDLHTSGPQTVHCFSNGREAFAPRDEKGRTFPYLLPSAIDGLPPTICFKGTPEQRHACGLQPFTKRKIFVRFNGIANTPVRLAFLKAGFRNAKSTSSCRWHVLWGAVPRNEVFRRMNRFLNAALVWSASLHCCICCMRISCASRVPN